MTAISAAAAPVLEVPTCANCLTSSPSLSSLGKTTKLTTAHGTVRLEDTPGGMAVICPDGGRFEGGLELLSCEAWDRMPGSGHHSSSVSLGFQLLGMGDGTGAFGGGGVPVFECEDE